MQVFNANYLDDYNNYIAKKNKATKERRPINVDKKSMQKHNSALKERATEFAEKMANEPSELEKKMQQFLDSQNVVYDFQRVFNIRKKNGRIRKFYIADFYVPSKNLIIETDGAFHDNQVKEDSIRTKQIQRHYPNIKILRWRWHDFESYTKMKNLLSAVT